MHLYSNIKVHFDINIKTESDSIEGNKKTFTCEYSETDSSLLKSIKWFKNESIEFTGSTDAIIVSNQLIFSSLNPLLHNGIYKCQIELITGQIIASNSINIGIYCIFL